MREIILDTETTGLDPLHGDRVVEIGCVEVVNYMPTGRTFHCYINPERSMPEGAEKVHGLSEAFLADKPKFAEIVDGFLAFAAESPLVIHNAAFDIGFLNAELARLERQMIPTDRAVDTVTMARKKFPGAPASLDALCRRFDIDNSARTKHGALLDAELLAEVYLELIGGRQPGLSLAADRGGASEVASDETAALGGPVVRPPRPHAPAPDELSAHAAFLDQISDPIWSQ